MLQDLPEDYFAAEDALVEFLGGLDGFKKVFRTKDVAGVKESAQYTPALHVLYGGDRVSESAQAGALTHVDQTWIVVLQVNLTKQKNAGVLLSKVIKEMAGFRSDLGVFERKNAPVRPGHTDVCGYYPLAYEIKFRVNPKRK